MWPFRQTMAKWCGACVYVHLNYGAVYHVMCIHTLKPTDMALMLQSFRRTMAQWCGACLYLHWSQQTWPWCCSLSAELWRSGVVHVYTYIEANRRGPDVTVLPPNYGAVVWCMCIRTLKPTDVALMLQSFCQTMAQWCGTCVYVHWSQQTTDVALMLQSFRQTMAQWYSARIYTVISTLKPTYWPWCYSLSAELWRSGVVHVYTYIEANRRGPDVTVLPPNYGAVVRCMCIRTLKPTDVALMLQSFRRTMAQWCGACVYVHWSQQTWPWCCSPSAELWRSGAVHVYTYIEANRRGPDVAVFPPNYGAVVWCMCIRTLKPTDVALMLQSFRRTMAQWCGACVYVHWSQQTWPWCYSPSA